MEFRQLEYFAAVAGLSSFTGAAAKLHVSQPTITTCIKNMEEELGIPLLVRDKRRVMLTYEGEAFLVKAQAVLEQFEQMIQDTQELAGSYEQVLNMGITPVTGSFLNVTLYNGFFRENPDIKHQVLELGSIGIMEAIDSDEIDLGFLVIQEGMEERYDICRIQQGQLKALVHRDNPLSTLERISLKNLAGERLIYLPPHSYIRRKLDEEFRRLDITPNVLVCPQQMITAFNLVENNAGISFVLGDGYRPLVHNEDTAAIPLDPPIHYETGFVWKKGKRISRAAKRCIAYVQRWIEAEETGNYRSKNGDICK